MTNEVVMPVDNNVRTEALLESILDVLVDMRETLHKAHNVEDVVMVHNDDGDVNIVVQGSDGPVAHGEAVSVEVNDA